jgi:GTP-binding protein
MLVDETRVRAVGGRGGNGCVSFRREKFVPKGGPDGGDGGDGGNVILQVEAGLRTLLHLRHTSLIKGGHGHPGRGKQQTGARGADCVTGVPPGTIVRDASSGAWIADLVEIDQRVVVARGGKGGKGNEHFKSSTNRAPRLATDGAMGELRELALELRLLADVGLVGLPNVGKSTLLARVSNARPRIADYPFTTLEPNLGIVAVGETFSFVMADIPGLVEGAHKGRGLGTRFLRHIERTRLLLFLIESVSKDPEADLAVLRGEVAAFSPALAQRPHLLALSKVDLWPVERQAARVAGEEAIRFSAHTGQGVEDLLFRLREGLLGLGPEEPLRTVPSDGGGLSEHPFAHRVDANEDLGSTPWPRQWFAGPVRREGEGPRAGR